MSRPLTLSVLLLLLLALATAWADPGAEARTKIEGLVKKLTAETASLQAERDKVRTHLASCEEFLGTLGSPKDAAAAEVTRAAVAKDRATLVRTEEALAGLERRVRISRKALDNLFQGKDAEFSASVDDKKGEVRILRKGEKQAVPLTLEMDLRPGDMVMTRKSESALLVFADGSKVKVGEGTSFLLDRDEPEGFLAHLKSGKAKFRVERLFKRRYEVRTATGALAVRGTSFTLETGPEGDVLTVHEGEVEVEGRIRVRYGAEEVLE